MPCNSAHAPSPSDSHSATNCAAKCTCSTTICKGDNFTFATKIPYDGVPRTTGASENILHLLIPSDGRDLIELRAAISRGRGVRFWRIIEIPYINLFVYADAWWDEVRWKWIWWRVSWILTSPLTAPEDKRLDWIGLKSSPRTGPVWIVLRRISDSDVLEKRRGDEQLRIGSMGNTNSACAMIFAGSHSASSPFSMPAAMTPRDRSLCTCPHAMRLNL